MTGNPQAASLPLLTATRLANIVAGERFELTPGHWQKVAKAHDFLQQCISKRQRIYGVTTGYGPLAHTWVAPEHSADLQRNLIAHLASGVGEPYSREQSRAIFATRLWTISQGHSGVSPATLETLIEALNRDIIPVIPSQGTVGASGDLTPLAHLASAFMGHGEVWLAGERMPATEALSILNWAPLNFAGKDALALVNGTAAMTGVAALNNVAAEQLIQLSCLQVNTYGELLEGHREAFHAGFSHVRQHPGQHWVQQQLWLLGEDSQRWRDYQQVTLPDDLTDSVAQQPMLQDPYSIRCAPQLLGAVVDSWQYHHSTVQQELNAVTDNPVLLPEQGEVIHGGNFYGQHVALASDALNNAMITLAVHCERRIARLTDERLNNGLPAFLRGNQNGLHSGFMGAQVTASALLAEMRSGSAPASIQSVPTNANNQDVNTMGTIAARRCATTIKQLRDMLAIESMILAQGVYHLHQQKSDFSPASRRLQTWVHQRVLPLKDDRPLAPDIAALSSAIGDCDSFGELISDLVKPIQHSGLPVQ